MDFTLIVAIVAAINLSVFAAGCALAVARTWRERHPRHGRRPARVAAAVSDGVRATPSAN